MKYFGKIKQLECKHYVFDIPAGSKPLELLIEAKEASDKEFVLLPEQTAVKHLFGEKDLFYSSALGAHFLYIEQGVRGIKINAVPEKIPDVDQLEFIIARWNRSGKSNFPRSVKVTAKDQNIAAHLDYVEVFSAVAQPYNEGS